MSNPPSERAPVYRKWAVLAAVGVGTFMSALDASIVNVLLPVMGKALGTSVAGIEWVVTVDLLVVRPARLARPHRARAAPPGRRAGVTLLATVTSCLEGEGAARRP